MWYLARQRQAITRTDAPGQHGSRSPESAHRLQPGQRCYDRGMSADRRSNLIAVSSMPGFANWSANDRATAGASRTSSA